MTKNKSHRVITLYWTGCHKIAVTSFTHPIFNARHTTIENMLPWTIVFCHN